MNYVDFLYQSIKRGEHPSVDGDMLVDLREDDKEQVIFLANHIGGPQIEESEGKGYGLFAERNYERGEHITLYGGKKTDFEAEGNYAFEVTPSVTRDAEYVFRLKDKGRWINEANVERKANVVAQRDDNDDIEFRQPKGYTVKRGWEFLWWYGPHYDRPWKKIKKRKSSDQVGRRIP